MPLGDLLADVLAAAAPHAAILGAAHELAALPALLSAPEAPRQEALAVGRGVGTLVSDLARRFHSAGGRSATSLGHPPRSRQPTSRP